MHGLLSTFLILWQNLSKQQSTQCFCNRALAIGLCASSLMTLSKVAADECKPLNMQLLVDDSVKGSVSICQLINLQRHLIGRFELQNSHFRCDVSVSLSVTCKTTTAYKDVLNMHDLWLYHSPHWSVGSKLEFQFPWSIESSHYGKEHTTYI